jgi:hypothetical protein
MEIIILLIPLLTGFWVYTDAVKRGKSSGVSLLWGIGVFLILIVFLPIWLITRPNLEDSGMVFTQQKEPKLCSHCGKYYDGSPAYCPNCGHEL